jgi:hypothetical protein
LGHIGSHVDLTSGWQGHQAENQCGKFIADFGEGAQGAMVRIYLDTNILIQAGWPSISVKLRSLLTLSRALQLSVVIPEPVEREMKANWFRDLETRLTKLTKEECSFVAVLNDIVEDREPPHYDHFDLGSIEGDYDRTVQSVKDEWRIGTTPFSSASLDDLFQMAIDKMPPFEDRGTGFQDAVILCSVIDDLKNFPGTAGIFRSVFPGANAENTRTIFTVWSGCSSK